MPEPVVVKAAPGKPFSLSVTFYTPDQDPPAKILLSVDEGSPVPRAFTPVTIRGVIVPKENLGVAYLPILLRGRKRPPLHPMVELAATTPLSVAPFRRITDYVHSQGQKIGIQLAHAGQRGYEDKILAPSLGKFDDDYVEPHESTVSQIEYLIESWNQAAIRAVKAGLTLSRFTFLSPKTNKRTDEYGSSFEGRIKYATEVVKAVKSVIPENVLLFFRISASDRLEYKNEG
ncbi:hypothetical protein V1509DRAFT_650646 [Lipomyces kononenkoae]